jgi:hypothetical protein
MHIDLTSHAQQRVHQRAIDIEIVDLLLTKGCHQHIGSGLIRSTFSRRDHKTLAVEIGRRTSMNVDKALNCYLIRCATTGAVVTVAKRFQETRFRRT